MKEEVFSMNENIIERNDYLNKIIARRENGLIKVFSLLLLIYFGYYFVANLSKKSTIYPSVIDS